MRAIATLYIECEHCKKTVEREIHHTTASLPSEKEIDLEILKAGYVLVKENKHATIMMQGMTSDKELKAMLNIAYDIDPDWSERRVYCSEECKKAKEGGQK